MTILFRKAITSFILFLCFLPNSSAETFFSKNSISYLKNTSNFEVLENDDINVITFEHASGHHWGDVFVFIDRINASQDDNNPEHKETYGEASARLSLRYLTHTQISYGPLKDLYIATTWEHSTVSDGGSGFGFDNYLVGVGTSWDISGFNYVNANVYHANNEKKDNDYQLTMSWAYPIIIGTHHLIFDGYFDWSSAADDHAADFHFNPQLRLDVGRYFEHPNVIDVGVEYSYWRNKFGIADIDNESVISLLVKVHI